MMGKIGCIAAAVMLVAAPTCADTDRTWAERLDDAFAIGKDKCLTGADDLGLINGYLTLNGRIEDVALIRGLYAPPYFCHDYKLAIIFDRTRVPCTDYTWRPEVLERRGTFKNWKITSRLYPIAGARGAIEEVEVENASDKMASVKIQFDTVGTVGSSESWGFGYPACEAVWKDGVQLRGNGRPVAAACATTLDAEQIGELKDVPPGAKRTVHFCIALGAPEEAESIVRKAVADPKGTIRASVAGWRRRVRAFAAKVPEFETDNAAYFSLYCRSLLHFLLCEWNSDAFVLKPYYSTGGMNGGCVGNYLWNLGEPYRLWPLVDPAAMKAHLRHFLGLDIKNCYAFHPGTGKPFGPYYPVNQEKVLRLIHAYVLESGDIAFLRETCHGKTMVEWAVDMALTHDDLTKPAVLADYGPEGRSHLELRRGFLYDGKMPDLNLRRIPLYYMADELCRIAGYDPKVDLVARAKALKSQIREQLWDAKEGWYVTPTSDGKRTFRYPLDIFHAFGWGDRVIDEDIKAALIRRLMDPNEFLGPCGIHSLSKKDVAYDESDVDHGGPGSCPSFAPEIVCELYRDGYDAEAEEVMSRLLWLGEVYPFVGDSHYADRRDYRRDTPLQCNIEGAVFAQAILFGTFGIDVKPDFSVVVKPRLPKGTRHMSLRNVRLAGQVFDIVCDRDGGTEVRRGKETLKAGKDGRILVPATAGDSWTKVSSFGFNAEDSTAIAQRALDSGAKKIVFDKAAGDWVVGPLFITNSHMRIVFDKGVTVRAKRGLFRDRSDSLFWIENAEDVALRGREGSLLVMNKSDYRDPAQGYTFSGWRHTLHIERASRVSVKGLTLRSSGGDGVYVRASDDVELEDLVCSDHFRQGISVIAARNLTVRNSIFENTSGAAPQCGLDIEPNRHTDYLENILFEDCVFRGNAASGILIHLSMLDGRTRPVSILFRRCVCEGNGNRGISTYSCTSRGVVKGKVRFEDCSLSGSANSPLLMVNQVENGIDFSFAGCTFDAHGAKQNVALDFDNTHVPVDFGRVAFERCTVKADRERVCAFDGMRGVGMTTVAGELGVERGTGRESYDLAAFAAKHRPEPGLVSHFKVRPVDFKALPGPKSAAQGEGLPSPRIRERTTFVQYTPKAGEYPIRIRTHRFRHCEGNTSGQILLRDRAGTDLGTFDIEGDDYTFMLKATGENVYRLEIKSMGAVTVESPFSGNGFLCEEGVHLFGGENLRFHFRVPASAKEVLAEIAPEEPASARLLDASGKIVAEMPYQRGTMVLKGEREPAKDGEIWTLELPKVREDCHIRVGGDALPILSVEKACAMGE